ncbi:MAG TPA: hypothetical protein VKW77_10530, partial [Acidimicrobiales bacterium]|nr:hypothetical protein [Acidimicrobiales bacterium]
MLRELLPPDTGLAYPAMAQLRPHLESEAGFVRQVDEDQRPGGYRLVAVLPGPGLPALSVAGFRLGTSLSWGRHVYVDD